MIKREPIKLIREVCENKSIDEIESAENTFRELILIVKNISERLEPQTSDEFLFDDDSNE